MIQPIDFLLPAKVELAQAVAYYDEQNPALGDEFLTELERTLLRISLYPDAWPKLSNRSRRCRMKRFPYGIVYQSRGERIVILAVMHLHRNPGYWSDREE